MIKLLGAVLVILATALIGERAARWERHRLDMLEGVIVGLTVLEAEIAYLASDLSDAMRKAANAAPVAKALFLTAGREVDKGLEAKKAWETACLNWGDNVNLPGRQSTILRNLGAAFGPWRGEDVLRHVRIAQRLLQVEADKARAKLDNSCRLWRYLGWAGGLMLVLVLV